MEIQIALKSTGVLKGIDTYYIPDHWLQVNAIYLIPKELINKLVIAHERKLKRFKVDFRILPKDPADSLNPVMRKIKLYDVPEFSGALVVNVKMVKPN